VFVVEKSGAAHVHAGSVHASDSEMALLNARDVYARRGLLHSIWVVPSDAIVATTPEDSPCFFDPAPEKIYRHPQFYPTPRGVKNL
jgi:ring-1,2-phenylacetyl-CoA epoxidase subunit PaaB